MAAPATKDEHNARVGGDAKGCIYLVDGSGYIFRAYYAVPPLTRKRDGLPTGAVLGFCNMLAKLVSDIGAEGAGHMAVLFDAGRKTFRNEIYSDYKAHRPPPPEDLIPQFALIREATKAFNIASVERDGFEADDLIASYTLAAVEAGYEVVIVSSDKDLMQLIRPSVTMYDPIKGRPIGDQEVREKFGVGPDKLIDLQALTGDSTDNVPGVSGIGVKTAAELLNEFGDLDEVLQKAHLIKQPKRRQTLINSAEVARLSRRLVKLRDDVPVDGGVDALEIRPPDLKVLIPFLEDLEFSTLLTRLKTRYGDDRPSPAVNTVSTSGCDYVAVQTPEELEMRVSRARANGTVAMHVEGSLGGKMQAQLVGLAFSHELGRGWYVPIAHERNDDQSSSRVDGETDALSPVLPFAQAIALLKPLLEDAGVLKIGHDLKRDMKILAGAGVTVAPIDDTLLLSFVLGGGRDGHDHADICKRLLDLMPTDRKDLVGSGRSVVPFSQVPLEEASPYAAGLADIVFRTHGLLRRQLLKERLVAVYETIERPLVPVLMSMERNGIRLDPKVLAELSDDFGTRMVALEADVHRLAGRQFNVGSPKQLGEVLFDEMGLRGGKRAKTGAWGTGADVLEVLASEGHVLPQKVLDWRHLAKLKSTYSDALREQVDFSTGRVHTSYQMAGAVTGRLASIAPNLQNIPIRTEEGRKIRRAFIPEHGWKLVSADYSQIELRLLAHMADIETLKEAFERGADIHALTASQVFGVPAEGIDPALRRRAKAINFGIIYGISAFGLARQIGVSRGDAAEYIDAYFERYPGIRDYMEQCKEDAREYGFVTTLFGRRVYLPGIHDRNHAHRAFSERAAINAPLQGSAADIIKRAMVRMHEALGVSDLRARMLLSVHDELLFEVPDEETEQVSVLAKSVMEGAAHLDVPLTVSTGIGDDWDQAH